MNGATTRVPGGGPSTPSPSSAIVPAISCPGTTGSFDGDSPLMTCRSLWHTPQAATRTSTSPGPGRGSRSSSIRKAPGARSTAARITRS